MTAAAGLVSTAQTDLKLHWVPHSSSGALLCHAGSNTQLWHTAGQGAPLHTGSSTPCTLQGILMHAQGISLAIHTPIR